MSLIALDYLDTVQMLEILTLALPNLKNFHISGPDSHILQRLHLPTKPD